MMPHIRLLVKFGRNSVSDYKPIPGNIGIVRSNGIPARLIQLGTLSRWNHVFIYIGNGLIIEATPKGVRIGDLAQYTNIVWNKHQEWYNESESREAIVKGAFRALEKPYNWVNILTIFFRIIGLKILANTKLMKRLAEKDGYICSELAEELYVNTGNALVTKPAGITTPGDLIEAVVYQ